MINSNLDSNHLHQGGLLCPAEEREGEVMGESAQGGAEEERDSGQQEEAREVKAPGIPMTPSRAEVLQHRLKHHPYRDWCPHCVRGKGREDRHSRSTQKEEYLGVPKMASDYFYIGQRRPLGRQERQEVEEEAERDGQTPVLVIKDTRSKAIFAHACPCKGVHKAVVGKVIEDLNTLGYKRVLVRTDGEPALLNLWQKVKEQWWGEVVKVESATGDHNSNGDAEQAVQKCEDEVRTWLDATNDAIKDKIPPS